LCFIGCIPATETPAASRVQATAVGAPEVVSNSEIKPVTKTMIIVPIVFAGGIALIAGVVTVSGYSSDLLVKNSEGAAVIWKLLPPKR
jgi:hypothetical protein